MTDNRKPQQGGDYMQEIVRTIIEIFTGARPVAQPAYVPNK